MAEGVEYVDGAFDTLEYVFFFVSFLRAWNATWWVCCLDIKIGWGLWGHTLVLTSFTGVAYPSFHICHFIYVISYMSFRICHFIHVISYLSFHTS